VLDSEAEINRRSQILKGLTELALLSLLSSEPHYGLEILEKLRVEAGLMLAEGAVYPLLHRLDKAGWIRAEWRVETGNARPRKYYGITPTGREELQAQERDWLALSGSLTAFLMRPKK
jgi:PadR family transcriptional regulator, regulatory protein PadR